MITINQVAVKHGLVGKGNNKRLSFAGQRMREVYMKHYQELPPKIKTKELTWTLKVRGYPEAFEPVMLKCLQDYDRFLAGESLEEIILNIKPKRKRIKRKKTEEQEDQQPQRRYENTRY